MGLVIGIFISIVAFFVLVFGSFETLNVLSYPSLLICAFLSAPYVNQVEDLMGCIIFVPFINLFIYGFIGYVVGAIYGKLKNGN